MTFFVLPCARDLETMCSWFFVAASLNYGHIILLLRHMIIKWVYIQKIQCCRGWSRNFYFVPSFRRSINSPSSIVAIYFCFLISGRQHPHRSFQFKLWPKFWQVQRSYLRTSHYIFHTATVEPPSKLYWTWSQRFNSQTHACILFTHSCRHTANFIHTHSWRASNHSEWSW